MNPLQGSNPTLQGGSGLSVQGSTGNPQRAASASTLQAGGAPSGGSPIASFLQQGQGLANSTNAFISNQSNQLAGIEQQILAAQKAQIPPVAPTLNLEAIKSAASAAAGKSVNPLYTQQLNQYLQNEAAAKAAQEQQNQLNITGYQQNLANTLAQNQQAEQYAGQQNALTQGNINAQSANYQLQSGNAENAKLAALQRAQGQGGLSGSGLGSQDLWMAENQKNVEDAQQQGAFQYNRDVANLATNNTFAELAQSSKFAGTQEKSQEAQANFNLNSYLRQAAYSDLQFRNALAAWQQQAIGAAQQNYIAQGVGKALGKFAGTPQYGAGTAAYAPELQTAYMPSQINQLSYQP